MLSVAGQTSYLGNYDKKIIRKEKKLKSNVSVSCYG